METEMVHTLTATFESHAQQTENGVEFWLARDLQHLLGYAEWRNFITVISKAKTESRREIDDIMLTRYACYLFQCQRTSNGQRISNFNRTYYQ